MVFRGADGIVRQFCNFVNDAMPNTGPEKANENDPDLTDHGLIQLERDNFAHAADTRSSSLAFRDSDSYRV